MSKSLVHQVAEDLVRERRVLSNMQISTLDTLDRISPAPRVVGIQDVDGLITSLMHALEGNAEPVRRAAIVVKDGNEEFIITTSGSLCPVTVDDDEVDI